MFIMHMEFKGIMRAPFNPQRLISLDFHGQSQQFKVTQTIPLIQALRSGQILDSTPVLFTEQNETQLVFQTRHFSMYNVMQGETLGQPWMASFCAVCNGGMSFSPIVNGKTYEFYGAGFYDAMILLADVQTGSYWDHLTGQCIYGEMQGTSLSRIANLTHATAAGLAQIAPDAQLAVTYLDAGRQPLETLAESIRTDEQPGWLPQITESLAEEDQRLPRFEMGLGVWTRSKGRYYPFRTLHEKDNLIFDTFDGQGLLVYIDSESFTPAAIFTDATSAVWRDEILQLNTGQTIQQGGLYRNSIPQTMYRPLQLFQRWYSFALAFPGCEIYRP
jgi:hypothetical protein